MTTGTAATNRILLPLAVLFLLLASSVALATSGFQSNAVTGGGPPAKVIVNPDKLQMFVGGSDKLVADAYDASGNQIPPGALLWSWKVHGDAVRLEGAGNKNTVAVTATLAGNATIQVLASDGNASASGWVVVLVDEGPRGPLGSIFVDPSYSQFAVGGYAKLFASPFDTVGNPIPHNLITWKWETRATNVRIEQNTDPWSMIVWGDAEGNAEIITSASDGMNSVTVSSTVVVGEGILVKVDPNPAFLRVNGIMKFVASAFQGGNPVQGAKFSFRLEPDPMALGDLQLIDERTVQFTAKRPGHGTLVAEMISPHPGVAGSAEVSVDPIFSILPKAVRLKPGESYRFIVLGPPDSKNEISWSTDCRDAPISKDGVLSVRTESECTVTARTDPPGSEATARVSVSDVGAKGIASVVLHPPFLMVKSCSRAVLHAIVLDYDRTAFLPDKLGWEIIGGTGELTGMPDRQSATFTAKGLGEADVNAVAYFGDSSRAADKPAHISMVAGDVVCIRGRVIDSQGHPLAGVKVSALETDTGKIVDVTYTDADGYYYFELPAGKEYRIVVDAPPGYTASPPPLVPKSQTESQDLGASVIAPIPSTAWWIWPLIGIGMIATSLAVAGLLGGEFLFTALLFAMVGLIARWRKEKVLDHFVRGQIFGAIQRDPGITYSDVRRLLQVANGELAYHLHTLEREGFVKSVKDGKYRRYYALEAKVPKLTGIRISTVQQRILDFIKGHQGCSQADVSRAHGMNLRTVNYNVQQLRRGGLVTVKVDGGRSHLYATGEEKAVSVPVSVSTPATLPVARAPSVASGSTFHPAGAGAAVSPAGRPVGSRDAARALAHRRSVARQIDIVKPGSAPARPAGPTKPKGQGPGAPQPPK